MMNNEYEHRVQYYETDQMGCVHHSNYIRWMEEARVFLLDQLGCSYKSMEDAGVICPVLGVSCQYKEMVHFGESVLIRTRIKHYNGFRLTLEYEMCLKGSSRICTAGESSHCFLAKEGQPLSLKRSFPEWDRRFRCIMEESAGGDCPS